jgi:hypothetical protein
MVEEVEGQAKADSNEAQQQIPQVHHCCCVSFTCISKPLWSFRPLVIGFHCGLRIPPTPDHSNMSNQECCQAQDEEAWDWLPLGYSSKKKKKQDPLHAIIDATEYNSITD